MNHEMRLFASHDFFKGFNNMKNSLFLGSKSQSRQKLLTEARIPFTLVGQDADETICDWNMPMAQIVERIALYKMDHVVLPAAPEHDACFVLTADTMSCDGQGNLFGKPEDRQDAIRMIKAARDGGWTGTAFCLDKKIRVDNAWHREKRITRYVASQCFFDVPDDFLEVYLEQPFVYSSAGAIFVEDFGAQFVKEIRGSYSTIQGLPMYELRLALTEIGFF